MRARLSIIDVIRTKVHTSVQDATVVHELQAGYLVNALFMHAYSSEFEFRSTYNLHRDAQRTSEIHYPAILSVEIIETGS